jgi:hypothetical protein
MILGIINKARDLGLGCTLQSSVKSVAVGASLFLALGHGIARADVIDPAQPVAGFSQKQLGEQWWAWALGIPADSNPLFDSTGAFASVNNNGPVFFVTGLFGSSERTIDVPANRPIFFPLLNIADVEVPGQTAAPDCFAEADPLACAFTFIPDVTTATNLYATMDGADLLSSYSDFRQRSDGFYVFRLPTENLFTTFFGLVDVGYSDVDAYLVSDGYWVALSGLAPGRHTLNFGASHEVGTLQNLVHFNAVPEPGTFSLMGLGLLGVGFLRKRRTA